MVCAEKTTFLYVEDDPDARELVSSMIARKYPGMKLMVAEDGGVGLKLFQQYQPEIVLTDMRMPVMDGLQMAAEIRRLSPEACIVAITAYSDTDHLLTAIEIGFNHYLLKPVDYRKLFATIDQCLAMLSLKREVNAQNAQIRSLGIALAAHAEELETANQDLEAFNYSVAHDLHNPLVCIGGYSRVILKQAANRLDEQHLEYLREIITKVEDMEHYLKALLNFSRSTRESLQRELIDVSEIVKAVVAELKQTDPARCVTFRVAEGVMGNSDRNLLRVVLQNLLGNAWKYTGKQQEAVIEFGAMNHSGITSCFVRDNGPGFSQAEADQIFIPFRRLAGTDEFKGFGIGLATVQRIIQRHGGAIWVEAVPGAGATFYFTLEEGLP
jgi:signal transduction histidine kinase